VAEVRGRRRRRRRDNPTTPRKRKDSRRMRAKVARAHPKTESRRPDRRVEGGAGRGGKGRRRRRRWIEVHVAGDGGVETRKDERQWGSGGAGEACSEAEVSGDDSTRLPSGIPRGRCVRRRGGVGRQTREADSGGRLGRQCREALSGGRPWRGGRGEEVVARRSPSGRHRRPRSREQQQPQRPRASFGRWERETAGDATEGETPLTEATRGERMASSGVPAMEAEEPADEDGVPLWKRELIQRRRQQAKTSSATAVRSARSVAASSTSTTSVGGSSAPLARARGGGVAVSGVGGNGAAVGGGGGVAAAAAASGGGGGNSGSSGGGYGGYSGGGGGGGGGGGNDDGVGGGVGVAEAMPQPQPRGTAPTIPGEDAAKAAAVSQESPARSVVESPDMRLEGVDAAASPAERAEEVVVGNGRSSRGRCGGAAKPLLDVVGLAGTRGGRPEECESDSSEELQYGPGIVHKLRSKYLNMTLREMNKGRGTGHGFRRATSLEDLLEHKQEEAAEKARRYAKKPAAPATAKLERYRNAARGNESIKRARSVETLVRYNSALEEAGQGATRSPAGAFKQDSEHVVLVERSGARIESRLLDKDRLKPLNKPKRIKPLLADTERPPPDLVKTTMRIFESSSIKKLKPKGDVAVKVATFKTINDTFKAQNQKKIIPKPPLQPKPLLNGNSKVSPSPRKIVIARKPTAELIEKHNSQESYRNEGVLTDSIVQSVSSVVSKFQQIEKSYSPSSSPEPSFNKIKFSPVPSPEPSLVKLKLASLDIKSPTTTPVPSPRTSPPKAQSPMSPKSEASKQPSAFGQKSIMNSTPLSNKFEQPPFAMPSEIPKVDFEQDKDELAEEQPKDTAEVSNQSTNILNDASKLSDTLTSSGSSTMLVDNFDESLETVDYPRTVSKSALDNIGKAELTVQFRFNDHPSIKSYLPRSVSNPEHIRDKSVESEITLAKLTELKSKSYSFEAERAPAISDLTTISHESSSNNFQERYLTEPVEEAIHKEDHATIVENKPAGAIASLGLIKSTTTTSFPQGNETKTIRSQKFDSNSPPQKQIGIIRPLVSTKTQLPQQNLSNREIEKNLINKVKSNEQPAKVVTSFKSAEEIQPVKKNNSSGGLWDSKPWNQQNNTMVFNFSNRKDVPDYIENDGLIIKRKRDKPRVRNFLLRILFSYRVIQELCAPQFYSHHLIIGRH
jgi:hypothetical protein